MSYNFKNEVDILIEELSDVDVIISEINDSVLTRQERHKISEIAIQTILYKEYLFSLQELFVSESEMDEVKKTLICVIDFCTLIKSLKKDNIKED